MLGRHADPTRLNIDMLAVSGSSPGDGRVRGGDGAKTFEMGRRSSSIRRIDVLHGNMVARFPTEIGVRWKPHGKRYGVISVGGNVTLATHYAGWGCWILRYGRSFSVAASEVIHTARAGHPAFRAQ